MLSPILLSEKRLHKEKIRLRHSIYWLLNKVAHLAVLQRPLVQQQQVPAGSDPNILGLQALRLNTLSHGAIGTIYLNI